MYIVLCHNFVRYNVILLLITEDKRKGNEHATGQVKSGLCRLPEPIASSVCNGLRSIATKNKEATIVL
jgi:hypothetical protein